MDCGLATLYVLIAYVNKSMTILYITGNLEHDRVTAFHRSMEAGKDKCGIVIIMIIRISHIIAYQLFKEVIHYSNYLMYN